MKVSRTKTTELETRLFDGEVGCEYAPCLEATTMKDPFYRHHFKTALSTRRKVMCLLIVGFLALLSIVVISQQLLDRHVNWWRIPHSQTQKLDLVSLQQWMEQQEEQLDLQLNISYQSSGPDLTVSASLMLVEDGIFWSSQVEANIWPGLSDEQVQAQMQQLRGQTVAQLNAPDWLHCGRDKNRFVRFANGNLACARFRPAHAEFVQGEVMAFYLARLLGITHTPTVVLSQVSSEQWRSVRDAEVDWPSDALVALIEWLPNLTKTMMPTLLRECLGSKGPPLSIFSSDYLTELDDDDVSLLAQWSDLIVFDYLTGNYDRVASMQDGADKESRPAILKETIHNLALSTSTGSLWLLDNESAFLDSYSLLYNGGDNGQRFVHFHQQLLGCVCVFRRKTVNRIQRLMNSSSPSQLLLQFISENEPLFAQLPTIYPNSVFMQHFGPRLGQVWTWIERCRSQVH